MRYFKNKGESLPLATATCHSRFLRCHSREGGNLQASYATPSPSGSAPKTPNAKSE